MASTVLFGLGILIGRKLGLSKNKEKEACSNKPYHTVNEAYPKTTKLFIIIFCILFTIFGVLLLLLGIFVENIRFFTIYGFLSIVFSLLLFGCTRKNRKRVVYL